MTPRPQPPDNIIVIGWLLKVLTHIWAFDVPGPPCNGSRFSVLSASIGLAVAELVATAIYLEPRTIVDGLFRWIYQVDFGWRELATLAMFAILLLIIVAVTVLIGMIIERSSEGRTCVGHVWQGSAVIIAGIILVTIADAIMSFSQLIG